MSKVHDKLQHLTIDLSARICDTIRAIDQGSRQVALVVDAEGRLVATVTDGDIRRALLSGLNLDTPITEVMRPDFVAVRTTDGPEAARRLMWARKLHQVPIIDCEGKPVDLIHIDGLEGVADRNTRVVLMAGGLGTRLRPLTETLPKPMLPVGDKPILELILRNFVGQGYRNFTISINYKGEIIRDYFGDGGWLNASIDYIEESKRMGTAGALSLLKSSPESPFIVMNSDLLTAVPFDSLVQFHEETDAIGTMCARDYPMQVPYGVIEVEETALRRIVEKPVYSHFVNAGIYVLSPDALRHVVEDEYLDMPELFERVVMSGARASVFPIQEYWMDIGRPEDLKQARNEFDRVFGVATEAWVSNG